MKQNDFPVKLEGCSCESVHTCDVRNVVISNRALLSIPPLLGKYRHVLLVYDNNTWIACARQVADLLARNHFTVKAMHYQQDDILIPNEEAIEMLLRSADEKTQVIIGVGAGVINDLCKWASFRLNLPYMIVATAPSMDGFASIGAAMIIKGMKVTYRARVPRWIVADTHVLQKAPGNMIRAGAGDIIGKISSLNDWRISHLINDEPLCQTVYNLVMRQVDICKNDLPLISQKDERAIARLMKALVVIGFCMSYVGNSRPASGSEHHLSHFFEVTGLLRHQAYLPHGLDVIYSTVVTCALRHQLIQTEAKAVYTPLDLKKKQEKMQSVFGSLTPELIVLQDKVGFYGSSRKERQARIYEQWPVLKSILADVPRKEEIIKLIKALGLNPMEFIETYSDSQIKNAILFAKELKDRYTLLWLMQDMGMLEEMAEDYIQAIN